MKIVEQKFEARADAEDVFETISDPVFAFPREYAVVGWFKW